MPVLIAVTAAALVMAVLLPVSGLLTDRFGARAVYASGIGVYALAVFPVFALFNTGSITAYAVGMLLVFGVVHAWFYGAQGNALRVAVSRAHPLHRAVDGVPAVRCVRVGVDPADPHCVDRGREQVALAGLHIPGRHGGH